ncbi:Protein I'm not dead yet [Gryllus bimaculatus]|nr:Protein I'm not dead yet [Gryllus bimaculatus]
MYSLKKLAVHWRTIVVVLVPLVLLPLAIPDSRAVPLPVTSLLPVVLFPLLGVLGTEQVCINYLKETNMMFIGGLIVAIAVENCNLHKRIALRTILTVGTSPRRLMLGFMCTTCILSMWISNTATTAMMVPIVQAVIDELKAEASGGFDHETRRKSIIVKKESKDLKDLKDFKDLKDVPEAVDVENLQQRPDQETICYYLGVAYASNLGGAGTLTGTGTNLTFKGIYDSVFPDSEGINFASWMIFCIPLTIVNILAAWLWLQFLFMGLCRKQKKMVMTKEQAQQVRQVIRKKYDELGPMTFHEASTLVLFIALVLMWFFREPEFIPGWAEFISDVEIQDATPAMLIVFLMFVLPSNLSFLNPNSTGKSKSFNSPLEIGGGFAMAEASKQSGLSTLIGQDLLVLKALPLPLILVIICTATCFLTEVSSNTAIANIVLPVLAEMAVAMKIHPLYFMMPATLCCTYAFMLPVATPPNAIVMAASNMKTTDMMKAGFGMNIMCLIILCLSYTTLGVTIYDLHNFPEWAHLPNATAAA